AYLEYADLPSRTPARLELAVCLGQHYAEWRERLGALGWGVREAWDVSATPEQYRAYIQSSRGEFSCVKPYCVQFVNSWTSDRTICYLASGKPAVVQHTGPSRLPDAGGGAVSLPVDGRSGARAGRDRSRLRTTWSPRAPARRRTLRRLSRGDPSPGACPHMTTRGLADVRERLERSLERWQEPGRTERCAGGA